ncbi:hypothetical protein ARMGADRAFT_118948 [Armillaria gallica]|uniref:Uncharacterized protein n=1 Tax=Armillaria gallica TaxID=47427 RepID=A0A2H3CKE4_ARMGA|nr:hypothetical protein ARMGADRAFT_118948 [Armillaria gallica]
MIIATEEIKTTAVEVLDTMNDMMLSYALGGILAEWLARVLGGMSDPQRHAPASRWKDLTRDHSRSRHERENAPSFGQRRIPSEWDLRIIRALIATCSLVSLLGYVGVYTRNMAYKHWCVFI